MRISNFQTKNDKQKKKKQRKRSDIRRFIKSFFGGGHSDKTIRSVAFYNYYLLHVVVKFITTD